jgi:hypothetical protein
MKLGMDSILLVVTPLGYIYFAIIDTHTNMVRSKFLKWQKHSWKLM